MAAKTKPKAKKAKMLSRTTKQWNRADNPWFDPMFTGTTIDTGVKMPKPLDPGFWDKIGPTLQQTAAPSEYDLALQTIRNMRTGPLLHGPSTSTGGDFSNAAAGPLKAGWSALGWTIDKLSRPMYGVENVVKHELQQAKKGGIQVDDVLQMGLIGGPLTLLNKDFWKGFTKKEKVSGKQIANIAGIKGKKTSAAVGFGLDVGLDPATYAPGGQIKFLAKLLKGGGAASKTVKALEVAQKAEKAAMPSTLRKGLTTGEQDALFPAEGFERLGPERAPVGNTGGKARPSKQGLLIDKSGRVRFGPESVPSAATRRPKIEIPDYPGKGRDLTETQNIFDHDPVKNVLKPRGNAFKEAMVAQYRKMGIHPRDATTAQRATAQRAVVKSATQARSLAPWRAALKKAGVSDDVIEELETKLGKDAVSSNDVRKVLKPLQDAQNAAAEGDFARGVAASRPAEEILADAAAGDPSAASVLLNNKLPHLSAVGNAGTTGGGNVPIRLIEDLSPTERDIVHAAMNKHGTKELLPREQADLVKHIRDEAKSQAAAIRKAGGKVPKEISDIIYSASNAKALARSALERFSREGRVPKNPLGENWNILDISDAIGGRQGFDKLFGVAGKKIPKGDVAYLHTLSKYATQTAKYLQGKSGLPHQVKGKPEFVNVVRQMMNTGQAVASETDAKLMQPILEDISRTARQVISNGGSDAHVAEAISRRVDAGSKVLKAQGVTEAGLQTFRQTAATMKYPHTPEGARYLADGGKWATTSATGNLGAGTTRAAETALGETVREGQTAAASLAEQTHDVFSKTTEQSIMGRFAAAFNPATGNKDLRQALLKNVSYRQQETDTFRNFLKTLNKQFTKSQLKEANTLLRSGQFDTSNQAAVEIKKFWDNTLRASGLTEDVVRGQSSALRGGATMEELNRALAMSGSKARFSKVVTDHLGHKVDLSEGTRWLESMQFYEADDILDHMSRVRNAVDMVLTNKSFMDDLGSKFGSTVATGTKRYKLRGAGTERVADLYFNKEIGDQVGVALKALDEMRDPHSQIRQVFEYGMASYKTAFTVMNPNHHVTNNVGNMFMNWIGGVNNLFVYNKASKMSLYERSVARDLDNLDVMTGEGALARAMNQPVNPAEVLAKSKGKNGTKMSAQQIFLAMKEHGVLIGATFAEDIGGRGTFISKVPGLKQWEAVGRKISEKTENWSRYAMFIDGINKHNGPLSPAAFDAIAAKVRKFHPDGTDLTKFERKYMRLIFPFYSWNRKAVPLMMEAIVANPGKVMTIPKLQFAIASAMGVNPESLSDPFPKDQAFPDWLRESGVGPMFAPGTKLPGLPAFTGYGMGSPDIPTNAVGRMFSGTPVGMAKNVASMTNPVFRLPVEMMRGQAVQSDFGGPPVAKSFYSDKEYRDKSQYFSDNLPIAAQLMRTTGRDPLGGFQPAGAGYFRERETGSPTNPMGIANWLAGLGLMDTGIYKNSALKERQKKKGLA